MLNEPAAPLDPSAPDRPTLRRRLLAERAATADVEAAHASLARELLAVLLALEPQTLGAYAAIRNEFNALSACLADTGLAETLLALPYCFREPRRMDYRGWNRRDALLPDEVKIPAPTGMVIVPEVLIVPCVGYTASGYRLGYGGGYFDRYLAAHPHITTVGVALSAALLSDAELAPQAHDRPLSVIVTERGPV